MALRLFNHVAKCACSFSETRIPAALLSQPILRRVSSSKEGSKNPTVSSGNKDLAGQDKDHPILVASHTNKCIVGCNCSSDSPTMNWFFIEEGPAQTCDCGFYFKLDRVAQDQWIPEYSRIMQFDESRPDPRKSRRGLPFSNNPVDGPVFAPAETTNKKAEPV